MVLMKQSQSSKAMPDLLLKSASPFWFHQIGFKSADAIDYICEKEIFINSSEIMIFCSSTYIKHSCRLKYKPVEVTVHQSVIRWESPHIIRGCSMQVYPT